MRLLPEPWREKTSEQRCLFEGLNNPTTALFICAEQRFVIFGINIWWPDPARAAGIYCVPILLTALHLWAASLPAFSTVSTVLRPSRCTVSSNPARWCVCGFLWQGSSRVVGCTSFPIYHQSEGCGHHSSFVFIISWDRISCEEHHVGRIWGGFLSQVCASSPLWYQNNKLKTATLIHSLSRGPFLP